MLTVELRRGEVFADTKAKLQSGEVFADAKVKLRSGEVFTVAKVKLLAALTVELSLMRSGILYLPELENFLSEIKK